MTAHSPHLCVLIASCTLGFVSPALALGQDAYDARDDLRPQVIDQSDGEKRFLSDGTVMRLKVGPDNGGSGYLFMGYDELPPEAGIPRHRHEIDEEILIAHRGTVRFTLGDVTHLAEDGDAVFLPPGHWISAVNVGPDTARVFFVFPRATVERCFQHIGRGDGEMSSLETEEHLAEERRWCRMSY